MYRNKKENEKEAPVTNDVDMFDFLDEILASDTPVVPMPGTTKTLTSAPNLDSSKVLNWSGLFPKNPSQPAVPVTSAQDKVLFQVSTPSTAQAPTVESVI